MIYTIGTARLPITRLDALMVRLGATIIDVRSSPRSRVRHYSRTALDARYGPRYRWMGDVLGGREPGVQGVGLQWLREHAAEPLLLLCMEEAPGDCHRHHAIAEPLRHAGLEVYHFYRNEMVETADLAESIRTQEPYPCWLVANWFTPLDPL